MSAAKKAPAKSPIKKVAQETSPTDQTLSVWPYSLFTDYDIDLFLVGKHFRLYEKMGSHLLTVEKTGGSYFSVWAPNAIRVSVVGDFNNWERNAHELNKRRDKSGIWEGFIPNLKKGDVYKYFVKGFDESEHLKGDPYAFRWEHPPQTASIIWDT
ncbi:MAG: 1,4-alpha-glucan branching protein GlgB, partial [Sphingobacteriales bacterium]